MNILEKIFGKKEKILTKQDLERFTGEVKGSEDAKELIKEYLKRLNKTIVEEIKIDMGKWHSYIIRTKEKGYLVVYKRAWLFNYGKIFNRPEKEGTGLNLLIAKYCKCNGIDELIIVFPDSSIYTFNINELIDYATINNTIRKEEDGFEAHIPVEKLKRMVV